MGRNLLLNLADHGYSVAGYDKQAAQVRALQAEVQGRPIQAIDRPREFVSRLDRPRIIIMLVPAGVAVDAVIQALQPFLEPGDLLVDGGNSYYAETERRAAYLSKNDLSYLGLGISGGEQGAREGACFMPGGDPEAYARLRPMLEATAAQAGGTQCVAYLGPGAAGHYVKMMHNGIEYAVLQLIAETYDLMKRGLHYSNEQLSAIYRLWNGTELNSYLIEKTAEVLLVSDNTVGQKLVDVILDKAMQKGTGKWAVQAALDLQVPVPTIGAAVTMRNMTLLKPERIIASRRLRGPASVLPLDADGFVNQLRGALYMGIVAAYAQGMVVLNTASQTYNYGLDLATVARIWRGGCIIRAALLEKIQAAYGSQRDLPNLLLDLPVGEQMMQREDSLRAVLCLAIQLGLPTTALMASLGYWDSYRSAWLPANLIQALRDSFGAHGYERIDRPGIFHTDWRKS
jgi:6-phosphogluconate dehydrogenase